MTSDQNKEIVRRFVERAQSEHDLGAIDELISPDFVDHAAMPGIPPNRDGVRVLFGSFFDAFPDFRATIHEQVAEGEMVITRKTVGGTHAGTFMGIPATGRTVAFDVTDRIRVTDGRIAEHWAVIDVLGLMQQLGVVPAAGEPDGATTR